MNKVKTKRECDTEPHSLFVVIVSDCLNRLIVNRDLSRMLLLHPN